VLEYPPRVKSRSRHFILKQKTRHYFTLSRNFPAATTPHVHQKSYKTMSASVDRVNQSRAAQNYETNNLLLLHTTAYEINYVPFLCQVLAHGIYI
jgi:hypothetical protein